jgi:tellurite resistance protein
MEDYQEAMVKSLVAVAWADGRVDSQESEVIEALIAAFQLSDDDAESIRQYARTPRSIEDVPLTELSAHDRRQLLQHAVILTYVDGEQTEREQQVLKQLVQQLKLPEQEAEELMRASEKRAKKLANLL